MTRSRPDEDGGPAFPHGGNDVEHSVPGMSLRDWFAGQALSGILAGQKLKAEDGLVLEKHWAQDAYSYADAMLEERKEVYP